MDLDTQKYINIMPYYVYRHIRDDNKETFYIGIGTVLYDRGSTHKQAYSRAYAIANRSKWWKNIVGKTTYTIEILFESGNYAETQSKEKEYIALFGRKDKGSEGVLVNLTDGGEGVLGRVFSMSEEQKKLLSDIRSIPLFCYSKQGMFLGEYSSMKEAAIVLEIHSNNIFTCFKHRNYCCGYYFFKEYKGDNLGYSYNPKAPHTNSKPVYCYKNGVYITTYTSKVDAAAKLGVALSTVKVAMAKDWKCVGYNLYHEKLEDILDNLVLIKE